MADDLRPLGMESPLIELTPMTQHHRRSPSARNITLATVERLTESQIANYFAELRWPADRQVCPFCGVLDNHYARRRRKQYCRRPSSSWDAPSNPTWQCKHCQSVFSVTSGTLFDHTKLPLRTILAATVIALGPGNGASALAVSNVTGVGSKSCFLFLHRLREAMASDQPKEAFDGMVQMDAGYFCGKPRKPNTRLPKVTPEQLKRRFGNVPVEDKETPWKAMGMTQSNYRKRSNKRAVLVVAQSGPLGQGSTSIAVGIARGETEYTVHLMSEAHIAPKSLVMTDEAHAYSQLSRLYEHYAVSHAKQFSDPEGVNDNHCEAFFSRMRRAEYGIYHGVQTTYLHFYACEAAWRHTHRRLPKSEQVRRLLSVCLSLPPSTRLRGYYEKKGFRPEVLIDQHTPAAAHST